MNMESMANFADVIGGAAVIVSLDLRGYSDTPERQI